MTIGKKNEQQNITEDEIERVNDFQNRGRSNIKKDEIFDSSRAYHSVGIPITIVRRVN